MQILNATPSGHYYLTLGHKNRLESSYILVPRRQIIRTGRSTILYFKMYDIFEVCSTANSTTMKTIQLNCTSIHFEKNKAKLLHYSRQRLIKVNRGSKLTFSLLNTRHSLEHIVKEKIIALIISQVYLR